MFAKKPPVAAVAKQSPVVPPSVDESSSTLPQYILDVLGEIQLGWSSMSREEFNPVPHALSLLDSSSLGKDYGAFTHMSERLERAMDLIVNDYYQAFNGAIHTFSNVVENIAESRELVNILKQNLGSCQDWLQNKRFDLLHLWLKSIQFKEINRILENMEELQKTPERVENLIQGKYFLTGTRTLLSALKILDHPEFSTISALDTLRNRLKEIHSTLHESILDELLNHIYLKSAFCLPGMSECSSFTNLSIVQEFEEIWRRAKDLSDEIVEDLDVNPESNSFHFMCTLLESLTLLGKLPTVLEIAKERLPLEIYFVVERTIQEIDQSDLPRTANYRNKPKSFTPDLMNIESRQAESIILQNLLEKLYGKLEMILQRHHFLGYIISSHYQSQHYGILFADAYEINGVWQTIQSEVKALLNDYFTNSESAIPQDSSVPLNELLKLKKVTRNRNQKQFHRLLINDGTDEVSTLYSNISDIIVQVGSPTEETNTAKNSQMGFIDKYANMVTAGHRLLVVPDAYNVLIVFGPTMEFITRVETVISVRTDGFRMFLDNFVANVFIPYLEDLVLNYVQQHVDGIDAFQCDNNVPNSYPLIKCVLSLNSLIYGMCRTLQDIPVHQEECINLIEMIIQRFHDKCLTRFRTLVAADHSVVDSDGNGIVSANWASNEELIKILLQNPYLRDETVEGIRPSSLKEIGTELKLRGERSLLRTELIVEHQKLEHLANLHYSIDWFLKQLAVLRSSSNRSNRKKIKSNTNQNTNFEFKNLSRFSQDSLPALPIDNEEQIELHLDSQTSRRFDLLSESFQKLSDTCLFTLRLEIRCHTLYYLDLAIREGNYFLEDSTYEPDQYILTLNQDLSTCDELLRNALPPRRVQFIFYEISDLMTFVLCSGLKQIKQINIHGIRKLIRNVQSLRQNLTNILGGHDKCLDKARQYFELLGITPDDFPKAVQEYGNLYKFDEYKAILDSVFKEAGKSDDATQNQKYQEYLGKLKSFFLTV
ncbi:hypothetical protein HK098_002078 [Nowakowskiella sp. JEL0407]|nr:hypothetical protein HK098_002078 [Nowakowskiella sp. JEL0407]